MILDCDILYRIINCFHFKLTNFLKFHILERLSRDVKLFFFNLFLLLDKLDEDFCSPFIDYNNSFLFVHVSFIVDSFHSL